LSSLKKTNTAIDSAQKQYASALSEVDKAEKEVTEIKNKMEILESGKQATELINLHKEIMSILKNKVDDSVLKKRKEKRKKGKKKTKTK
jgi:hypothetical protein